MNWDIEKAENVNLKYHIFRATMLSLFVVYIMGMLFLLFFERAFNDTSILYNKDAEMSYLHMVHSHMILTPFRSIRHFTGEILDYGLNPFSTSFSDSHFAFCNLFGNIILFMPIGIFIPYFFPKYQNFFRFAPLMLFITFSIESVQLLTLTGTFDIDDIILNVTGGCMGCILFLMIQGILSLFDRREIFDAPQT